MEETTAIDETMAEESNTRRPRSFMRRLHYWWSLFVAGALLGCALGWMGTRALQSQLYEVQALDARSWTAAVVTLAVVLLAAVFWPARQAAHVNPIAALRAE